MSEAQQRELTQHVLNVLSRNPWVTASAITVQHFPPIEIGILPQALRQAIDGTLSALVGQGIVQRTTSDAYALKESA